MRLVVTGEAAITRRDVTIKRAPLSKPLNMNSSRRQRMSRTYEFSIIRVHSPDKNRSGTRKIVESNDACLSAGQKLVEPCLSRDMFVIMMCCFPLEFSQSPGDVTSSQRSWQVLRMTIGSKASAMDNETPMIRFPSAMCSVKGSMVRKKLEVARTAENDA